MVSGQTVPTEDWDNYYSVAEFLKKQFPSLTEDEVDLTLYHCSSMCIGEEYGISMYGTAGEIRLSDYEKSPSGLSGKLVLHINKRYSCSTEVTSDNEVIWKDDVNPEDDQQGVAIFI